MIPSALTRELRQGMADFLRASFWSNVPGFEGLLARQLETPGALMQGPYLALKLPFRRGEVGPDFFAKVPMGWPPHAHQEEAFRRLSGEVLQHTLVATGTGSGKTETFLVPILAECARQVGKPGIKAILIYPMNALATDQARRLAGMIEENPHLKGKVTAGLFVGQREESPFTSMGATHLITDRKVIADSPPDILLTNYKMLDYLLMRPRDQRLWKDNGPETLRFVVVDEIHTFDGAQGTDLACLLRRLKRRLHVREGMLCCVGTSATLGGPKAAKELVTYASQVFGEPFEEGSIVGETRVSVGEFLEGRFPEHLTYPLAEADFEAMQPVQYSDELAYVQGQAQVWFGERWAEVMAEVEGDAWRVRLGEELKKHVFFQQLVATLGGGVKAQDAIVEAFRARLAQFRQLSDAHAEALLASFVALISAARSEVPETAAQRATREDAGKRRATLPFVQVQIQLWQREMRRMVATVEARPTLRFFDDLTGEQRTQHLPVVYCANCGVMGWASKVSQDRKRDLSVELRDFYTSFFENDPRIVLFYPSGVVAGQEWAVDPVTLRREQVHLGEPCPRGYVQVVEPGNTRKDGETEKLTRSCPRCGAHEVLTLLGYQAATLTSAFINQLYASRFNDDKKLLTFSDSVQDAAHRAGFFGARTWRLNVRVAMQQALMAHALSAEHDPDLSDVAGLFMRHWLSRMSSEDVVATFLPPGLEHEARYRRLHENGQLSVADAHVLLGLIERRIDWEAHNEYGLNARIGRTLPRSLSSVAYLDDAKLAQAAQVLLPRLQNEVGGLRDVTDREVQAFLLGVCRHMQDQGGVFQRELPRQYLETGGKTFLLNRSGHLPNYGSRSRLPVFVTLGAGKARFEPLLRKVTSGKKEKGSWFQIWFRRSLAKRRALVTPDYGHVYQLAFEALCGAGLCKHEVLDSGEIYGLLSEALKVGLNAAPMRCGSCFAPLSVAGHQTALWEGVSCMERTCDGVYTERGAQGQLAYYQRMYATGDVYRVVTAEHTGLLGRDARQDLETQFKAPVVQRWEPNLLSCTPTLEMGIDIGALSTAIMCSVPPAQANYLQRVGRAGRRDGNALILTVTGSKPHDLFFFSQPEEMIAGEVRPPGVYLNASAVLERQLTAYCMDRWVYEAKHQAVLPSQLKEVFTVLDAAIRDGGGHSKGFPYDLLGFIEAHQTKLLAEFLAMFSTEETKQEARTHLTWFMEGDAAQDQGSLRWKILNGLFERRKEYKALYGQIPKLSKRLRKLKALTVKDEHTETEITEVEREQEALRRLARSMREASVLEFLTDEGLLPNYAFPESGVTLRSVISRKKEGSKAKYERFSYEYTRSAASAISELAPGNYFYADGHRVRIEKIDMTVNAIETWQFCDNCDCAMPASQSKSKGCPTCDSPYWSDASQKRNMLKLRQVFAWSPDSRSRIGDDREERTPQFYNKQMLVMLEERGTHDGWVIDDPQVPFGFEYIRRVVLREVNFGEHTDRGEQLSVGGESSVRKGFELCEKCGMVQKRFVRRNEPQEQHDYICPARGKEDGATLIDCLYLYREVRSEAVRILMPFLEEDGDEGERQHSFIAALQMGLSDFFGGSIDHLRVTTYSEPVAYQSARKQYLLLYDTIPGGTGYLKELVRSPEKVFQLLRASLERLKSCSCSQGSEGKNGCYRCLFAYRNSHDRAALSRKIAIELLSQIVRHEGSVTSTKTLEHIQLNGLFDSVLEARFIESLRRVEVGLKCEQPHLSKQMVDDSTGYFLKVGDERWRIQPQVVLGPKQGVALMCRPDFVFWPARSDDPRLPVAVFTDGFGFHKDRIDDDMRKRMALLKSGRFLVWSLTWGDVDDVLKRKSDISAVPLFGKADGFDKAFKALSHAVKASDAASLVKRSSHALLMDYLGDAQAMDKHRMVALLLTGTALLTQKGTGATVAGWRHELASQMSDEVAQFMGEHDAIGARLKGVHTGWYAFASRKGASKLVASEISVACGLSHKPASVRESVRFKAAWRDFLRLFNVLQFMPRFVFVTCGGSDHHEKQVVQPVVPVATSKPEVVAGQKPETAKEEAAWDELITYGDGYVPLILALRKAGCPLPEQGFELPNARDHPEGLAELAWETQKIAMLFEDDDPAPFTRRGWTVMMLKALEEDPSALVEAVGGRA